jgi:hypothetical protein
MRLAHGNRSQLAAVILAGAIIAAASAAEAAMAPPPAGVYATTDAQLTAGGCGPGRHRLLTGGCSAPAASKTQGDYLRDLRPCQPGTHSESFPNPQGYRCVLNR